MRKRNLQNCIVEIQLDMNNRDASHQLADIPYRVGSQISLFTKVGILSVKDCTSCAFLGLPQNHGYDDGDGILGFTVKSRCLYTFWS